MTKDLLNKLIYRSKYRGCKETEIILDRFAKSEIHSLSYEELIAYDKLLDMNDVDLYHLIQNPKSHDLACKIRKSINLYNSLHKD